MSKSTGLVFLTPVLPPPLLLMVSCPTDLWSLIPRPSISISHVTARPPLPNSFKPALSLPLLCLKPRHHYCYMSQVLQILTSESTPAHPTYLQRGLSRKAFWSCCFIIKKDSWAPRLPTRRSADLTRHSRPLCPAQVCFLASSSPPPPYVS